MSFKDDKARAIEALNNNRNFVYNGKTYTPAEIARDLTGPNGLLTIRAAQEQQLIESQTATTKQEANLLARQNKTTKQALARAKKKLKIEENNKNIVLTDFRTGKITEQEYNAYFETIDQLKTDIAAMESGTPAIIVPGSDQFAYRFLQPSETGTLAAQRTDVAGRTSFATPGQPTVATTATTTPPTGAGKTMQGISGPLGPTAIVPPVDTGGAGTTTNFKSTVTKQQVTDELTRQGLASTPENRQMVRQQLETGKAPVAGYQAGWEDEVRRQYSQYSWMLDDLDRTKYKDVFDLLAEAVNPQTRITDPELFKTRFESTSWYQELATQQMGRKVRSAVGALSFNPANYAKLLNNAMRFGWEGDNLKAEAYREVFRKNNDGTFANPNAVGEARKSNDYLAIKTIGNAYLSPMSDDRIVDTLTGKTTQDDLLRIYREKAKVSNPHLAAAIDAGVTLEDIAYDYRKAASDVLGVPLAGIPLTEDFLGAALKGGEPGKPRLMTTNEWKFQLKSNPDYGYQFTGNARKEVNDIVANLEKAFGFVQ